MMRPVILSTVSCLLVLGTIATTCISLELARRRLEHDKDTKRGMMDLEYLKFRTREGEAAHSKDGTHRVITTEGRTQGAKNVEK